MKYTQTTLDKLEAIPEQAGYVLHISAAKVTFKMRLANQLF